MVTESGTLPIGVEFEGQRCRAFTLRPLKVRDSFDLQRSPDAAATADDAELRGLALLGRRLDIAGVGQLTLEQMLDLHDEDLGEILLAEGRLTRSLERFRTGDSAAAIADSGAGDGRVDA